MNKKRLKINLLFLFIVIGTLMIASCKKKNSDTPEPEKEVPATPADPAPVDPLAVTTISATNITGARVTLEGNVTADGGNAILERGFFGDITTSPLLTTANKLTVAGTTGSFTFHKNGLNPNTTFYIKSFVRTATDTAYGDEINFTTTDIEFGDFYEGGYVFYIDNSGIHGLVADSLDLTISNGIVFGCGSGVAITSTANGTGQANTTALINFSIAQTYGLTNYAVKLCDDLDVRGYDDWYVPSFDEALLMYTNLKPTGLGSLNATYYWSSTQNASNTGLMNVINFTNGSSVTSNPSFSSPKTRAVRTF